MSQAPDQTNTDTRLSPDAPVRKINIARMAESFALLAATIALGALFGVLLPHSFLSWANVSTMLGSQAVLVVLALALIIPLTAGDFDLSIASMLTLSSMLIAVLNAQLGWSIYAAMAVALVTGGHCRRHQRRLHPVLSHSLADRDARNRHFH